MKCELCGYPIKPGQLFVDVRRAVGNGEPVPPPGTLFVHVGPCPAVPLAEPCPD